MKETGIIMSGSHPVDILEGRKTMTRRTWGLAKINKDPNRYSHPDVYQGISGDWFAWFEDKESSNPMVVKCPYGGVGDRLWVRETYALRSDGRQIMHKASYEDIVRELDIQEFVKQRGLPPLNIQWKPSIFMPRSASRILLEITELRAERLQSITEEDALSEGITRQTDRGDNIFWYEAYGEYHGNTQAVNAKQSYKILWDSLNAKRGFGWDKNDWVWPISFRIVNTLK